MKTIYSVKAGCVVALMMIAGTIQAQDDNLKRELTLEREYDPSVQDANKVNTLPEIKQPKVQKTTIDYATQTVPANPEKEISVLSSGKVMTDIVYNKNRGYFNVGAGTYLNINGDFGYHFLNTDKDQLNLFLSHRSSGGKRKYIQAENVKQKVHLNDNLAGLNYVHNFDKASMKLGARYGYSAFNYFGYNVSDLSATNLFSIDTKQVNQQISLNTGVESREGVALGYLLDLDFTNFSHKYGLSEDVDGIKENTIGVKAGLHAPFGGNQRVGVFGKMEYLNYSLPTLPSGYVPPLEFDNHAEVSLTPYYLVEGDFWKVKLGANVMFITGENDKIFASPNIAVDVRAADKTILYLKADGQIQSNSAFEMSKRNRYVNPWQDVMPSRVWLDGIAGLKSGVAPGFWFDIFAGYKATDNDVLFIQKFENNLINYSAADYYKTKLFFAGVALKYSYQDFFDFSLKGVFNNWSVEEMEAWVGGDAPEFEAYGRPKAEITSIIDVRPIDKLTISAKYYLATGRKTVFYALQRWDPIDMDNINELNVTGLYTLNKTVGVYAQLNNLLFQKYDLLYGYPAQGFSAMVGLNINF
ncbi:MAG: TonB-dependent receptor [Massilibacteroides sp.]|nr:TonB-dependent receptor [Massilibacteroides sp.]MDD3061851.1 TonB-dependent receptor [Massilibacteroides sp.]MDD4660575.1 TonB-dependent receptor [Massilibacteroides sp.]